MGGAQGMTRQLPSIANSSSLFHANHSSLRGFQTAGDTALEIAEVELCRGRDSNAASMHAWKPRSGECLACTSALESAGIAEP